MAFRKTQLSVERVGAMLARGLSVNEVADTLHVKTETLTHFCRLHDIAYRAKVVQPKRPKLDAPSPAMLRLAQHCLVTRRAVAERLGEPWEGPIMGTTVNGAAATYAKKRGDY